MSVAIMTPEQLLNSYSPPSQQYAVFITGMYCVLSIVALWLFYLLVRRKAIAVRAVTYSSSIIFIYFFIEGLAENLKQPYSPGTLAASMLLTSWVVGLYTVIPILLINLPKVIEQLKHVKIDMEKKRSIGITVLGRVEVVVASLSGICLAVILMSLFVYGSPDEFRMGLLNHIQAVVYVPYLLPAGIFTLKLKPAGRIMNLIMGYYGYIVSLYNLIRAFTSFSFKVIAVDIVSAILFLSFIYYLTRPKVKEQFTQS